MKYVIDRIENSIAILENIEDKTKKEVPIAILPLESKEGSVIVYKDDTYTLDSQLEEKRYKTIKSKFDLLRKK